MPTRQISFHLETDATFNLPLLTSRNENRVRNVHVQLRDQMITLAVQPSTAGLHLLVMTVGGDQNTIVIDVGRAHGKLIPVDGRPLHLEIVNGRGGHLLKMLTDTDGHQHLFEQHLPYHPKIETTMTKILGMLLPPRHRLRKR